MRTPPDAMANGWGGEDDNVHLFIASKACCEQKKSPDRKGHPWANCVWDLVCQFLIQFISIYFVSVYSIKNQHEQWHPGNQQQSLTSPFAFPNENLKTQSPKVNLPDKSKLWSQNFGTNWNFGWKKRCNKMLGFGLGCRDARDPQLLFGDTQICLPFGGALGTSPWFYL